MPGNPDTPALLLFGVILEAASLLSPVPLVALSGAVVEVVLDVLLASTGEALEGLSGTAAARLELELGAVEAAELDAIAPGGP